MKTLQHRVGAALVLGIFLLIMSAPLCKDPVAQHLSRALCPPCPDYLLGTDHLGRSILSRLAWGGRYSLSIALTCVCISFGAGCLLGITAGYRSGWIDLGIMRLSDALLAFPGTLLAIVLAGILGGSFTTLVLALSATLWCDYCRLARNLTHSVKTSPHVEAGKILGYGPVFLIRRYILPQVMPQMLTLASLSMGRTILNIAGLGFLGIGLRPPLPEWGGMINQGLTYLSEAPWLIIFPAFMIFVTVLACQLLADFSLKGA